MAIIQAFQAGEFLNSVLSLFCAFVLGTLIGAERQYRQRTAGLRTNVLVAVGAAAFTDLGMRIGHADGAIRIVAYVVSGVGFLGAGVIMKEGMNVRGLNTAATLWCSAAVGALSGVDLAAEAALVTAAVLAGNTLLRPSSTPSTASRSTSATPRRPTRFAPPPTPTASPRCATSWSSAWRPPTIR